MYALGISEEDYARLMVWFGGPDDDLIGVYRKCPDCCRFISKGEIEVNGLGDVRATNWICKKHGEVNPYWERH